MKEDNKYYIPLNEEFYIGYEYEKAIVYGIGEQFEEDGMFPVSGWEKKIVGIIEQNDRDIVDIPFNTFDKYLRVKYLDKEAIEAEGWKEIEELSDMNYTGYKATRKRGLYPEVLHLLWWSNDKLKISSESLGVLFWGNCKSVNELRKIQTMLQIRSGK